MGMTKEEFINRYFRDMEKKRIREEEERRAKERLINEYENDRYHTVEKKIRAHTIKGHN